MIISHKHKFVFVKIPKSAGESLVEVLSPYIDMSLWNPDIGNHEIYRDIVGRNPKFGDYFKFAFVRNPWDIKVSRYFYIKHTERDSIISDNFAEWVRSGSPYRVLLKEGQYAGQMKTIHDWYPQGQLRFICETANDWPPPVGSWIPNGKKDISMDFIGKFENLQEDFNTICDKIGVPRHQLPHHNKSNHKHYTEYYDDETRQIVAERYAKDIEYFGYKFGE